MLLPLVLLACAVLPSPAFSSSYERGKRLLEQGRYEEAADAFRQSSDPGDPRASPEAPSGFARTRLAEWHAAQAQAALEQGVFATAVAHANRALELGPDQQAMKVLVAKARQALKEQKQRAGKRASLIKQAEAAEARGHDQQARALWKKVESLASGDRAAAAGLARVQARWERANPTIRRAAELADVSATPHTEEYRVTIGDVIEVFVWQQADLSRDVVVRPDGRISFPLVGDVDAVNLSLSEVDTILTERLTKYVKFPDVSLAIKRFGGTKTIVLGEVGRPGVYVPTGEGRALDVIAMAGGFSPSAGKREVLLIRGGLASPQVARLDMDRILSRGDVQENVLLQPNDILYVAKAPRTPWGSVKQAMNEISPILSEILVGQAVATNFGAREFERSGRSVGVE